MCIEFTKKSLRNNYIGLNAFTDVDVDIPKINIISTFDLLAFDLLCGDAYEYDPPALVKSVCYDYRFTWSVINLLF